MKIILGTALIALTIGTAAGATTYTSSPGAPDPGPAAGETIAFDFNSPTPQLTGSYSLVTGSLGGVYAAPAGDATQYAVVPTTGAGMGTATLDLTGFATPIKTLSFYWGSVDGYNTVKFYSGVNEVFSLNGSMLPPANGNQSAAASNTRVFFNFAPGENITSAKFISDGVAFEFDDVATSQYGKIGSLVPEPATWGMLMVGFGMVGFMSRRRQRLQTVTG